MMKSLSNYSLVLPLIKSGIFLYFFVYMIYTIKYKKPISIKIDKRTRKPIGENKFLCLTNMVKNSFVKSENKYPNQ